MIKFKQGILGATSQAHTFFIMSGMYICQYRLASQCLITEETRCKCVFTVRMSSCCSLSLAELLPGSQITEKLNSAKGAFSAPKEKIESRKGYGYICVLTWGECWRPISKLTTHTYRNHALCITRKRGCPPSTTILSSSICYLSKNCATEIVLLFDQQMPTSMLKFAPAHCAEWCFTTLCRLAKLGWYGRTIQILPWRFLTLWASQLLECLATGCQSLTRCSTKADSLQHSLQHHIAGGRGAVPPSPSRGIFQLLYICGNFLRPCSTQESGRLCGKQTASGEQSAPPLTVCGNVELTQSNGNKNISCLTNMSVFGQGMAWSLTWVTKVIWRTSQSWQPACLKYGFCHWHSQLRSLCISN
jgi:hypothetical protein